jgi:hypothetical protein
LTENHEISPFFILHFHFGRLARVFLTKIRGPEDRPFVIRHFSFLPQADAPFHWAVFG